jgi:hypothetical protein
MAGIEYKGGQRGERKKGVAEGLDLHLGRRIGKKE